MESMKFYEALEKININKEETLRRFSGNEALMQRFVCKFPQDKTFNELKAAIANKDMKAIELTAHTLKGTSGNLGFTKLYELSTELVNAVRAGDNAKVEEFSPKVIDEGTFIIDVLNQVDK